MLTRGVALEHLERTFGGLFVAASSEVSIGLVPVVIAARDPERAALIMVNLGGVDVLVAPDQRVSTTRGILLAAGGGGIFLNIINDSVLPSEEWSAITTLGGQAVYVLTARRDTAPTTTKAG